MKDAHMNLELNDLQAKEKGFVSSSPKANSLYDSDDDLDDLDDFDLEASSKWWPSFCIHAITLSVVAFVSFLVIFGLVYFGEIDFVSVLISSHSRDAVWDKNFSFLILFWIAHVLCFGVILSFLLSIIPAIALSFNRLVVPGKIETTKEYIEVFQELRTILLYSISMTFAFVLCCILFRDSVTMDLKHTGVAVYLFRVVACLLILSYFLAVEKVLIQMISVRFHRTAYKQRIEEARVATQILDKLNTAVSKKGLSYSKIVKIEQSRAARHRAIDRMDGYSDSEFGDYATEVPTSQGSNSNTVRSFKGSSQRGTVMNLNFDPLKKPDDDPSSYFAARKLSRKIFFSLQKDRKQLFLEDFIPWFKDSEEAEQAFKFFDKDNNGDVSRRELRDSILRAYKERKDLVKALRDTSQVVGKLDKFFVILAGLLAAALCGILFGKDAKGVLISISAFFLAVTFMIGESARQFVQSIIFLFVMHPYDVGDRVYIDDVHYFVKKVGLLGTEFRCSNGQITYIPHYILIAKVIYNARRSEKQVDVIDFLLSYNTPKDKIVKLKESINRYLDEEESREFNSNPLLAINAIEDANKLKMFLRLEHKSNWQDNTKRNIRKTRFLMKLRDICMELGLSYSLPIQKLIHVDGSSS